MLFFPRFIHKKNYSRAAALAKAALRPGEAVPRSAVGVAPHRIAQRGVGQRAAGSGLSPTGTSRPPGLSAGMGRPSGWGGGGGAAPCAARSVPAVGAAMGFIPFQLVIDSLEHHRGYFIESIQSRLFIRSRYYSKGTISWKKKIYLIWRKKKKTHTF